MYINLLTQIQLSTNFLQSLYQLSTKSHANQQIMLPYCRIVTHNDVVTLRQTIIHIPTNYTFLVSKLLNSLENFQFRLRLTTF